MEDNVIYVKGHRIKISKVHTRPFKIPDSQYGGRRIQGSRRPEIQVGYRPKTGKKLVLTVGYSHPVEIEEADGVEFEVPSANRIIVKGIDKQKVGAMAAKIRGTRPPEPYKGKGIRYENERIIRKEGKTGA